MGSYLLWTSWVGGSLACGMWMHGERFDGTLPAAAVVLVGVVMIAIGWIERA